MNTRTVRLVDDARKVLAIAQVADEGNHFSGTIDLDCLPASLRTLFNEFEEIVNGQMFSFLDEIQERIASLSIKAVFENAHEVCVRDLQVFPSTGDVSFKLAEVPASPTRLA